MKNLISILIMVILTMRTVGLSGDNISVNGKSEYNLESDFDTSWSGYIERKKGEERRLQLMKELEEFGFKGLDWNRYIESIRLLESPHSDTIVNRFGYAGKYQIHRSYLSSYGFDGTLEEFLSCSDAQDLVMFKYTKSNYDYLNSRGAFKWVGSEVNGIQITMSGILAASHLVGRGKLMDYLKYEGDSIYRDGNGLSLEVYLSKVQLNHYDQTFH